MICQICEQDMAFRWTDSHGVGACITCGAPYIIYHYDNNDQRIADKPPELAILPEWAPLTKQYWKEMGKNCAPGAFNFPGSSYEVASSSDFRAFDNWMDAHKDEHPPLAHQRDEC